MSIPIERINWATSLFLVGTALTALIGVPLYLWHFGIDLFQIGLFVFYVYATGMSITLGYHRLFAHKAFPREDAGEAVDPHFWRLRLRELSPGLGFGPSYASQARGS